MALDRLAAKPREAIFVGDSEIDADTALATELRFVLVTFGYPHGDLATIPADAIVDGFDQIPGLIRQLAVTQGTTADS